MMITAAEARNAISAPDGITGELMLRDTITDILFGSCTIEMIGNWCA